MLGPQPVALPPTGPTRSRRRGGLRAPRRAERSDNDSVDDACRAPRVGPTLLAWLDLLALAAAAALVLSGCGDGSSSTARDRDRPPGRAGALPLPGSGDRLPRRWPTTERTRCPTGARSARLCLLDNNIAWIAAARRPHHRSRPTWSASSTPTQSTTRRPTSAAVGWVRPAWSIVLRYAGGTRTVTGDNGGCWDLPSGGASEHFGSRTVYGAYLREVLPRQRASAGLAPTSSLSLLPGARRTSDTDEALSPVADARPPPPSARAVPGPRAGSPPDERSSAHPRAGRGPPARRRDRVPRGAHSPRRRQSVS